MYTHNIHSILCILTSETVDDFWQGISRRAIFGAIEGDRHSPNTEYGALWQIGPYWVVLGDGHQSIGRDL